ncbi:mucin-like protein [Diplodia corticola]|uniref:Mucin-like protein n=1 Tax=Diplodia corticola TaxID=236234 RepID=A0A1J9RTR9_9PEZI|nr:mucin-like protein [Diplodia corticola]OJD30901.1 mucin-like protein [Diplodia corticola]
MPAPLLSAAEYESMPDAVRRKYFSSLERLRMEHAAHPVPDINRMPRRPQTSRSSRRSDSQPRSESRGRRRLRKAHTAGDITEAEAQWFLSLPDKVIKSCMSREEAILLAGRCETFLLDSDSASDLPKDHETSPLPVEKRRRSRSSQGDSVIDAYFSSSRETQELPEDMPPPQTHSRPNTGHRRASYRRTVSISNTIGRLSTSSAPPLPSPLFGPAPQTNQRPRATTTNTGSFRYGGEVESETKYYQDPEARMKLRLYLASPHKFDEVVEYGFPLDKQHATQQSTPEGSPEPSSRATLFERQASRDLHNFLRDDAVSFLDYSDIGDESDEESSLADLDTPDTPADPDESFHTAAQIPKSNYSSLDSNGLPTLQTRARRSPDVYPQTFPSNREMTLRMTLTRPDLRADEQMLYGWQQQQQAPKEADPLALEELPPVSEDTTGMHGPFAVNLNTRQGNLVRKFFHKVKKGKQ